MIEESKKYEKNERPRQISKGNYNYDNFFISHGHNTIFENPITESPKILRFIDWSIRFLAKVQKIHSGFVFRKGKFDCLVGVNLLREGLDLPELSFIGILRNRSNKVMYSVLGVVSSLNFSARYMAFLLCCFMRMCSVWRFFRMLDDLSGSSAGPNNMAVPELTSLSESINSLDAHIAPATQSFLPLMNFVML